MADDPLKRLEEHGRRSVPSPEPGFADRLEAKLRVSHAQAAHPPNPRPLGWLLPRVVVAVALVAAGVFGTIAVTSRDAGVPVVIDAGEPSPPADFAAAPPGGDEESPGSGIEPSVTPAIEEPVPSQADPTPTVTPQPSSATATAAPQAAGGPDEPDTVPTTPPASPPTALPTVSAAATPTTLPNPTAAPTARPTLPAEVATPVAVPTPTPTGAQRPSPSPTPATVREPVVIELECGVRTAGDVLGVVCSWDAPVTDLVVTEYEVLRSRNGADAVVVARQRPANTNFVDRDVVNGDRVAYVVRGLDRNDRNDRIVAASARHIVDVTTAG